MTKVQLILALLSVGLSLGALISSVGALLYSVKAYNSIKAAAGRGILVTKIAPESKSVPARMTTRERMRWIERKWAREAGKP